MVNLFSNPKFVAGEIASNETFKYLDIPEYADRTVLNILEDSQYAPFRTRLLLKCAQLTKGSMLRFVKSTLRNAPGSSDTNTGKGLQTR